MNQVRDWADKKSLGGRAHFDLQASPAELVIDSVKADDEGLYRCRVDFKKSPTRNARTNLTVVGKLRLKLMNKEGAKNK